MLESDTSVHISSRVREEVQSSGAEQSTAPCDIVPYGIEQACSQLSSMVVHSGLTVNAPTPADWVIDMPELIASGHINKSGAGSASAVLPETNSCDIAMNRTISSPKLSHKTGSFLSATAQDKRGLTEKDPVVKGIVDSSSWETVSVRLPLTITAHDKRGLTEKDPVVRDVQDKRGYTEKLRC